MRRGSWLALALVLAAGAAQAQLAPPDPDWKEAQVPAPPPLRTQGLIPIDLPGSALRFGVDPASIGVTSDGIVRYVVVAASGTGAVNAFYEGVRCRTGEVRLYARHNPEGGWVQLPDSEWQSLHASRFSRHSLLIARNGVCNSGAPNHSVRQIVRDLSGHGNGDWRFWNN